MKKNGTSTEKATLPLNAREQATLRSSEGPPAELGRPLGPPVPVSTPTLDAYLAAPDKKDAAPNIRRARPKKRRRGKATLTPREVAGATGFGVSHTYRMLAEGIIPSIKVGNRFFTPRVALERWLASCGDVK
jgi:excisionase family DNA binding protein